MPKLISDARYRKLLAAQAELDKLQKNGQSDLRVNQHQIDAIAQRLNILELAVVQLARVLNPAVQSVDDALKTAEKFGRPRTQGAGD